MLLVTASGEIHLSRAALTGAINLLFLRGEKIEGFYHFSLIEPTHYLFVLITLLSTLETVSQS